MYCGYDLLVLACGGGGGGKSSPSTLCDEFFFFFFFWPSTGVRCGWCCVEGKGGGESFSATLLHKVLSDPCTVLQYDPCTVLQSWPRVGVGGRGADHLPSHALRWTQQKGNIPQCGPGKVKHNAWWYQKIVTHSWELGGGGGGVLKLICKV